MWQNRIIPLRHGQIKCTLIYCISLPLLRKGKGGDTFIYGVCTYYDEYIKRFAQCKTFFFGEDSLRRREMSRSDRGRGVQVARAAGEKVRLHRYYIVRP